MTKPSFVPRIHQLDAVQLDDEIYKLLRVQTEAITKHFTPGTFTRWQPEIDLLLKYLIWHFSLRETNSTFGQQLLNLSYINLNKKKVALLLFFNTVPEYIRQRLISDNYRLSNHRFDAEIKKSRAFAEFFDNILQILNFIWTFYFLYSGNQSQVIEKILNIYNEITVKSLSRNIGYSYMSREILWHGLIELFTIIIPMINFQKLQRLWSRLLMPKKSQKPITVPCKLDVNTKCGYCNQRPILPRWAGCRHVFCYYCLEAQFVTLDYFKCPVCKIDLYPNNVKAQF